MTEGLIGIPPTNTSPIEKPLNSTNESEKKEDLGDQALAIRYLQGRETQEQTKIALPEPITINDSALYVHPSDVNGFTKQGKPIESNQDYWLKETENRLQPGEAASLKGGGGIISRGMSRQEAIKKFQDPNTKELGATEIVSMLNPKFSEKTVFIDAGDETTSAQAQILTSAVRARKTDLDFGVEPGKTASQEVTTRLTELTRKLSANEPITEKDLPAGYELRVVEQPNPKPGERQGTFYYIEQKGDHSAYRLRLGIKIENPTAQSPADKVKNPTIFLDSVGFERHVFRLGNNNEAQMGAILPFLKPSKQTAATIESSGGPQTPERVNNIKIRDQLIQEYNTFLADRSINWNSPDSISKKSDYEQILNELNRGLNSKDTPVNLETATIQQKRIIEDSKDKIRVKEGNSTTMPAKEVPRTTDPKKAETNPKVEDPKDAEIQKLKDQVQALTEKIDKLLNEKSEIFDPEKALRSVIEIIKIDTLPIEDLVTAALFIPDLVKFSEKDSKTQDDIRKQLELLMQKVKSTQKNP